MKFFYIFIIGMLLIHGCNADDVDGISLISHYEIIQNDDKLTDSIHLTSVLKNLSKNRIVLPSKNIGPAIAFYVAKKGVSVRYSRVEKERNNGEYYIESEYSFFPVVLNPGESMVMDDYIDISKGQAINNVEVIYRTDDYLFGRFGFTAVHLTSLATLGLKRE